MTDESFMIPAGKKGLKRATYIFISLILVLTFFSSTLNNLGLVRVEAADVEAGRLSYDISGSAVVTPSDLWEIYPEHGLIVKKLAVKNGDTVKKGQLLAEFDVTSLEEEMNVKLVEQESKKNEKEMKALTYGFDIENAEEKSAASEKDLETMGELYKAGAETAANIERLKTEREAAEREYQKLVEERDVVLAGIQGEMDALGRRISSLKSDIEKYKALRSPVDGGIWEVNARAGALADASSPVFKLAGNGGNFYIKFSVNTLEGKYLQDGDMISVTVPSMDKKMSIGISSIKPIRTPADTALEVMASISGPEFKGGELVDVKINKASEVYGLIVPNSAVRTDTGGRYYVYVIRERKSSLGKEYYLQKAFVYVEASDKTDTAITSGLSLFERVVAESDRPVMAGDRVKIQMD